MRQSEDAASRVAGRRAWRSPLAVLLAAMIWLQAVPAAGRARGDAASQTEAVKQQMYAMPDQSMVHVKLKSKEKLRGRLVKVLKEGFVVKTARGEIIEDRTVAFSEVQSVKADKGVSNFKSWLVLGAVFAVVITVLMIKAVTAPH